MATPTPAFVFLPEGELAPGEAPEYEFEPSCR